jgi:carbamoyl-phosphate synthase small subunit
MSKEKAILALEDGTIFEGISIGASGQVNGEIVFNTSMTGYQEILTDPSYAKQIVTLTYPHIGNTGTNSEDTESDKIWCSGLVIRSLSQADSSWRNTETLSNYLIRNNIQGISDIDTRKLTRIIREKGAQSASIFTGNSVDSNNAVDLAKDFEGLAGLDLAKEVTTESSYDWKEGTWRGCNGESDFRVAVLDFGIKKNILRILVDQGYELKIFPAKTSCQEILDFKPNGVFLSNGPGDPEPCIYAIDTIKELIQISMPIFGICLGHQLLAIALGGKTSKMKFGHHGANHPVQDLKTSKVSVSSQNHGFTVEENSLPTNVEITHKSLFDGTIQGIQHSSKPFFSFQGHPEASPGPHDLAYLFSTFDKNMTKNA